MFSHFITALSLSARDNRLNYPEKKEKKEEEEKKRNVA